MKKLFALEDDKSVLDKNQLLIDKVIDYKKKEDSPVNLTADVLKQRHDLKKDIEKELTSNSEDDNSNNDNIEGNTENNTEGNSEDNTDNQNNDSGNTDSNQDESGKNKEQPEEDTTKEANSKDDLMASIGSGLNQDTPKEDTKEATESFSINTRSLFKPLEATYSKYKVAMESYNFSRILALEEQPVAYVKEAVIASLNNAIALSTRYLENNTKFINDISVGVKKLNEELTIFSTYADNEKIHFNFKLISDKDILGSLSIPEKSDLRETSKVLMNFNEIASKLSVFMLENHFDDISKSLIANGFTKLEGTDDFEYKQVLPGFNLIRATVVPYTSYTKTKIDDFITYKLRVMKPDDIFNLNAIEISDDNKLNGILSNMNSILSSILVSTDNLNTLNASFTKLIEGIKIKVYDVQEDKTKDLASLGLDDVIKDIVKFKMVNELLYININMCIDYVTSCLTVLKETVELSKK